MVSYGQVYLEFINSLDLVLIALKRYFTKDPNIGNIPVGQWFPNNTRGSIRIRQTKRKVIPSQEPNIHTKWNRHHRTLNV
jgi:hypothetical protein